MPALLLVREAKVHAEFGIDKACHTLLLVNFVKGLQIRGVERNDFEVLSNPGGSDRLGERCNTAGDYRRTVSAEILSDIEMGSAYLGS